MAVVRCQPPLYLLRTIQQLLLINKKAVARIPVPSKQSTLLVNQQSMATVSMLSQHSEKGLLGKCETTTPLHLQRLSFLLPG